MSENSFKIFNKDKTKRISLEFKLILFLVLLLVLIILTEEFFFKSKVTESMGIYTMLTFFSLVMYLALSSPLRYERLKGSFKGNLRFAKDYISIDETKYNISEIKKIEIDNLDIRGKWVNMTLDFEPKRSNGVKNFIKLYLNTGDIIEINFLQTKNHNVKTCKEEFISYYDQNKISWNNLGWLVDVKKENIVK